MFKSERRNMNIVLAWLCSPGSTSSQGSDGVKKVIIHGWCVVYWELSRGKKKKKKNYSNGFLDDEAKQKPRQGVDDGVWTTGER